MHERRNDRRAVIRRTEGPLLCREADHEVPSQAGQGRNVADLKQAFESHLEETKGQIERLDRVFEILGKSPKGKMCHRMEGVLQERSEVLEETEKGAVRDAALISAARRVEHYEMAGYGCCA
jgi:ferritin-like metal-binding protein YciE